MKISEKMLEDWLCENPEELFGMVLLGRQIRLEHGILDILGYRPDIRRPVCIELKARPLKEKDIGQVLRYAYDVDNLMRGGWSRLERGSDTWLTKWDHNIMDRMFGGDPENYRDEIFERLFYDEWVNHCSPTLIGAGVNDSVYAAARSAGIVVLVWSFEDGVFTFDLDDRKLPEPYFPEWLRQMLHLHIEATAKEAIRIVDEDVDPLLVGI
jgi:hypothetical protein